MLKIIYPFPLATTLLIGNVSRIGKAGIKWSSHLLQRQYISASNLLFE